MARLFSNVYDSDKERNEARIEAKRLIFVAFEGDETEPQYFEKLRRHLGQMDNCRVEIFPVIRKEEDTSSHPKHVRDGLYEYYSEKLKKHFNSKKDELWIVVDIDRQFSPTSSQTSEERYAAFLTSLEADFPVKIRAAISNPSFELWLILHFKTEAELDLAQIKLNRKIGSKTYIKRLLSDCIASDATDIVELTPVALKNSVPLRKENCDLLLEVGTSVPVLIESIFKS